MAVEPLPTTTAKFDLTLQFTETGGTLRGDIEYKTDLFCDAEIQQLACRLEHLLCAIQEDPACRLSELAMVDSRERERLTSGVNQTQRPFPDDRCVAELFADQARKSPDQIAIVDGQF